MIDSHCHLDFYAAGERRRILDDAFAAGLSALLSIGLRLDKMAAPLRLAAAFPDKVFCSAGVHPLESGGAGEVATSLRQLAKNPHVVALGESGLDYFKPNHPPKSKQIKIFETHIRLAEECGLPLIVHNRSADDEVLTVLEGTRVPAVMHCFCGDEALMEKIMAAGLYVSFGGIITYKNAERVRKAAIFAEPKRVLLETDAPFLAPEPHRGKRNQPALMVHTAEVLARCLGMAAAELSAVTDENFYRLFPKAQRLRDGLRVGGAS